MDAKEYIEKSYALCKKYYDDGWHCIGCPAYNKVQSVCKLKHNNEVSADEKIKLLSLCIQNNLI